MSPHRLVSRAALALLLIASALAADPPPPPSSSASRPFERERLRVLDRLREHGVAAPSASSSPPATSSALSPPSSASPPAPSGHVLVDELTRRWRALAATRLERRERHRAKLLRELGQRLGDPQVKEELKLHATRVAELSRIQFLAENTRSGADRERLLARVSRLLTREAERHRKRLEALR